MSTKSSLLFKEFVIKKSLHIYLENLDGNYYMEDEKGRVQLPKKVAEEFAKILKNIPEDSK